ncbi:hypothetical protein RRF57_009770 [Xylaria bambusicola]|uniref:Uncharacterized protein n=1 Tax=Xylaria bambusicola TaxID=326684 RepID=A0AAN7ZC75_9PEZI
MARGYLILNRALAELEASISLTLATSQAETHATSPALFFSTGSGQEYAQIPSVRGINTE